MELNDGLNDIVNSLFVKLFTSACLINRNSYPLIRGNPNYLFFSIVLETRKRRRRGKNLGC